MTLPPGGYSKFADYYDFLGWGDFSREAFRRLKRVLELLPSSVRTILDLACGTGELALLLEKQGYRVTGVDLSQPMLKVAGSKKGNRRLNFTLGDIRHLHLGEKFDLVCCFFDSLNHLTSKSDLLLAFATARRHLRSQGHFIFDMITPRGLRIWQGTDVERGEDYFLVTEGELNSAGDKVKILIEAFIRRRDDLYDHFREVIRERAYPPRVVTELLAKAGFRRTVIESFDRRQTIRSAERLLYVVR